MPLPSRFILMRTLATLVICRSREKYRVPCSRQRIVQGPYIRFGPAIVVGRDDIDGAGDQGKESKQIQLHDNNAD